MPDLFGAGNFLFRGAASEGNPPNARPAAAPAVPRRKWRRVRPDDKSEWRFFGGRFPWELERALRFVFILYGLLDRARGCLLLQRADDCQAP